MFFKKAKVFTTLFLGLGLGMSACTKDEVPVVEEVKPTEPSAPRELSQESAPFAAETVYFNFDSAELSSESQAKLSTLAKHLSDAKESSVQVEGHCDERGTTAYNMALGQRRAESVKGYLVNLGVEDSRISTISYGEERPKNEGHDEAAYSQNRRAEFNVK